MHICRFLPLGYIALNSLEGSTQTPLAVTSPPHERTYRRKINTEKSVHAAGANDKVFIGTASLAMTSKDIISVHNLGAANKGSVEASKPWKRVDSKQPAWVRKPPPSPFGQAINPIANAEMKNGS